MCCINRILFDFKTFNVLVQNEWNQVKHTNEIKYTVISTS